MLITTVNFANELPNIKKNIAQADFIAIDTELTGVEPPSDVSKYQNPEQKYQSLSKSVSNYIIYQMGIVTFQWDEVRNVYVVTPYNFYVIPNQGKTNLQRQFVFSGSGIDFKRTVKTQDFNKWIYEGINYLNGEEEKKFREQIEKSFQLNFTKVKNLEYEDSFKAVLEECCSKVGSWLETPTLDYLDLITGKAKNNQVIADQLEIRFPQKVYCQYIKTKYDQTLRVH